MTLRESPSPDARFAGYPCWCADAGGQTVGYLVWHQTAPGEREILWLFVAVEWRRRGIASRLLEQALSEPARWFLDVRASHRAAQQLYARFGFEPTGRRREYYSGPTEDAIVMSRPVRTLGA